MVYTHRVVVSFWTEAGLGKSLGLYNKCVFGRKFDILDGARGDALKLSHRINDDPGADRDSGPAVGFDLCRRHAVLL